MAKNFVGIDKNGTPLHVGDIVKIENAYFKNDNGLYFVRYAPNENPDWCGNDFSLSKLNKNGSLSKNKYNLCSWPIAVCINNWAKKQEANEWNKNHATIEIVTDVDPEYVAKHFAEEASDAEDLAEYFAQQCGTNCDAYKSYKNAAAFNKAVADKVSERIQNAPEKR